MFIVILALISFIIAGIAAYFSVQGLATLYAGAFLSVLIMGGALEVGKLVATSYLYRYWNKTNFLLKTYLLISVFVLMGITSVGIFGFLTAAYQKSLSEYSILNTQVEFIQTQKNYLTEELNLLNSRITTLNESRKSQESRLPTMSREAAKPVYEDIARAAQEITDTKTRMNLVYDEIKKLDFQNLEYQKQTKQQKDISTLKYAAELFNTDLNTIVKWFTLIIVLVFDPLAVCLVLAYNNAVYGKKNKNEKIDELFQPPLDESKNYVKIQTPENVKYQDK